MSSDSRQKSSQMPPNEGPSLYEAPMRTPSRRLKVVVIGAGMACIEFLYKAYNVYHLGEYVDFTVFEANEDVGGTWLVNRYPGVACDIAAHVYTFSFAPNPEWSSFYASGSEIWRYIKKTVDQYNLARDMKFKHRVTAADFDESKGQWDLQIENHEGHLFTEHCNILISATGFLSRWKWPQIDGLHSFQGGAPVMHSASWDEEYDFTGKRIAVIGNGSSGIQIVPEMAKVGSKVVNFARSGTWILAGLGNRMIDGRANYIYSEEEKHRFREDIDALKAYRKEIQQQSFASFSIFVKDSEMQTQAVDATKKLMLTKLNNYDDLAAKLIPNWPIGCRRATPGLDYLEALTQPHVSLVQEPIQRVTEHGITTVDGLSREFDVIICATGFDVSYRPGFPLRGRDGVDLAEKWKEAATTTTTAAAAAETGPLAYLSICVPGFPNYFMFTGPNAPVGHGALMAGLGWTAEYIAKWIVKLAEEDIKWVEVKEDATQEFNAYADQIMQTLVWSSPCKSWYKNSNNDDDNHNNAEGRVTALWAGSGLGFREMVSSLRPEDFVIRYHSSNRFRFMGNGRVKQEFQPGADLAWFMD